MLAASNDNVPNIARNNHYVPEATLRRWSEDETHVWGYRLLVSRRGMREWRRERISGLTRQTDLYTQWSEGEETDAFETFITRQFEEPGQAAISRLVGGQKMDRTDWHSIARFVVTQDMRTPRYLIEWLARFRNQFQQSLESVMERLEKRRDGSADDASELPTTGDEASQPNHFRDVFSVSIDREARVGDMVPVRAGIRSVRSVWLASMRHLLTGRAEIVCGHQWCVMKPAPGHEWPLTDHPVLCLNYESEAKYDFSGGWGRPGTRFIMPVSPRLAVYTQVGTRPYGPLELGPDETRRLQQLFVERAFRWVLAREPMEWVAGFRPRVVDAERFTAEQAEWKRWQTEQARDEAEFDQKIVGRASRTACGA